VVKNISARGSAHLVIPEGAEQLVMDALGLWASAYMPVRLEVRALGNPTAFAALLIGLSIAVVGLEVAGARACRALGRSVD